MQLLRIPCAFHENEFITNFCVCPKCLLPLCPTCVKIHTAQHIQMKVNPEYEHVQQMVEEIGIEIEGNLMNYNSDYKDIVELDARIQQFRSVLTNKIDSLKVNIISQVETYFSNLQSSTAAKISSMNSLKALTGFKDNTKKSILYMKAIQRALNDPYKVMRTIIKFKAEKLKDLLSLFTVQARQFVGQLDTNFISFSVREDYKLSLDGHLDEIKKIEVHDFGGFSQPIDLSSKLKEVIHSEYEKKEIKKSIANILHRNSTPNKHLSMSRDQSIDGRRRSLSKGKGLTVMQNMGNLLNNTFNGGRMSKPIKLVSGDDSFENMPFRGRISTTAARRVNR